MLRGLWRLAWLEIKIFMREPLGAIGTVIVPVFVFVLLARLGRGVMSGSQFAQSNLFRTDVPVLAAVLIALNAVLSLVSIISIYREGGILKRLRATPLRPQTILTAHVLVKLLLASITMTLTLIVGRRYYPTAGDAPMITFTIALLISTWSILSIGFILASLVPSARFAQPVGSFVLYPMIALSGLFAPLSAMAPEVRAVARALPLTYAVSLLKGAWNGDAWSSHAGDIVALVLVFIVCTAISTRIFRWE